MHIFSVYNSKKKKKKLLEAVKLLNLTFELYTQIMKCSFSNHHSRNIQVHRHNQIIQCGHWCSHSQCWFWECEHCVKWKLVCVVNGPILNFLCVLVVLLRFVLQSRCGQKSELQESVGEWIQTESVTGAMNCTDSSKHDAISASYCYSLNPNTIRHSNTTIMRGARLTLSSTPSCLCYRFTIICEIWADKERNVRKQEACISVSHFYSKMQTFVSVCIL